MASVNDRIADLTIGHAVDLQRYSNGVVRRMLAVLNRVDDDLVEQIRAALERMTPEQFSVERLEALLESVRRVNAQAYQALRVELSDELRAFATYEAQFQHRLFTDTMPAQVLQSVTVFTVSGEQVYAAAMARPFQGRLLSEWYASLEEGRALRLRDAIRIGYVENQSIGEIVKRVRGTRARQYADGVMAGPRRHVEAVVQTAISHVEQVARKLFHEANADLIKAVIWSSTLDDRTSEGCRIRDGKRYTADADHRPIGHSIPWLGGPGALHWRCRSKSVAVLKAWEQMGLPEDFLSSSTRASMDGQVPREITYADWIKRQSAERQDDILGPTRGALMREGGLTLDRFYNDRGRFLTLDELRDRDARAFARAGL